MKPLDFASIFTTEVGGATVHENKAITIADIGLLLL